MRATGTALLLSLVLTAPAVAQQTMTSWTPDSMRALLQEMSYGIVREGMSGTDPMIVAQPPNHGLPVNIYGVGCTTAGKKTSCTRVEVRTAFKLADAATGPAATARIEVPGIEDFEKNGMIHVRQFIDLSGGLSPSEVKTKLNDYQTGAKAALKAIEDAGMLAQS